MTTTTKGFTLIELLIVIGILAILATTVVLVLQPGELLAQTRDTQRIGDLDAMRTGINLYLTQVPSPNLGFGTFNCRDETIPGNFGSSYNAVVPSPFGTTGDFPTLFVYAVGPPAIGAGVRTADGNGWLPVEFTNTAVGGSPFSILPIDPNPQLGSGGLTVSGRYYAYTCNNGLKTYELNANMESTKYGTAATGPEDDDGGTCATSGAVACTETLANTVYEVGNDPGLNL